MAERLFDPEPDQEHGEHASKGPHSPLAARMRPRTLDEFVGQEGAVGPGTPLRALLEAGSLVSLILWGPPGSGKTSLARVIASIVDAVWVELSAVTAGVKDVRAVIDDARSTRRANDRETVLFLDEIHRFNKAQQDALLPAVEDGTIHLVGATTENPYFELNAPLLSRCELVRLEALTDDDVATIVERALADPERGLGGEVTLKGEALAHLISIADGDARTALNALSVAAATTRERGARRALTREDLEHATQRLRYDRAGDQHYDMASAFIKSMRGSDPDASVYWLLRMLEAGEDPRFLARRMVILASEDIGLADPTALPTAVAAFEALDRVGLPEARYALVQAAVGLAVAPKSNTLARTLSAALRAVNAAGNAEVPVHLRDSSYEGARALGHGEGYNYPHDHPDGHVVQQYLPDRLVGTRFYEPRRIGHEAAVADRLAALRAEAESTGPAGDIPETERHHP